MSYLNVIDRTKCYVCGGVGHILRIDKNNSNEWIYRGNYLPCYKCGGYGTLIYDLCDECSTDTRKGGLKKEHYGLHHRWHASGEVYTRHT